MFRLMGNVIGTHYYLLYQDFWRVIVAASIAVPLAHFTNGAIVSKLKIYLHGKLFIFRYIFSISIAQAVLVSISYPINLGGKYDIEYILQVIFNTWVYKIAVPIILFPLARYLVNIVKKSENTDYYDFGASYNPFYVFSNNDARNKAYAEKSFHKS